MARPRGAKPTPRHVLAAAMPHRIRGTAPAQMLALPQKLSMWLNATFGCCVTSEEAFNKACSGIFIADAVVQDWATKHDVLNGANLGQVLGYMQHDGFAQDGNVYNDGPPVTVDWTSPAVLQNAIAQGPVKLGVAANQLENVVGESNGWVATGFQHDPEEDHCVSLSGYGPAGWLAQCLGTTLSTATTLYLGSGVSVRGIDPSAPSYGLFTWSTVGIIDVPSFLAITGEAWLRKPNTMTVGSNPPASDPVTVFPAPGPAPTPGPTPTPPPPVPVPPAPAPPPPPAPPPSPVPAQYQWALELAEELYEVYGPGSLRRIARLLQMFGVPAGVVNAVLASLTEGYLAFPPRPYPGPGPRPRPWFGPQPYYPEPVPYYPEPNPYNPTPAPYYPPAPAGYEQYAGLPWVVAALARGISWVQIIAAIAAGIVL